MMMTMSIHVQHNPNEQCHIVSWPSFQYIILCHAYLICTLSCTRSEAQLQCSMTASCHGIVCSTCSMLLHYVVYTMLYHDIACNVIAV